jgi:hypothetical protein
MCAPHGRLSTETHPWHAAVQCKQAQGPRVQPCDAQRFAGKTLPTRIRRSASTCHSYSHTDASVFTQVGVDLSQLFPHGCLGVYAGQRRPVTAIPTWMPRCLRRSASTCHSYSHTDASVLQLSLHGKANNAPTAQRTDSWTIQSHFIPSRAFLTLSLHQPEAGPTSA